MSRCAYVLLTLLLFAALWAGCGSPWISLVERETTLGPRPSHYGISLPYPVAAKTWAGDTSAITGAERIIPVLLSIDHKGRVIGVAAESPADQPVADFYALYLSGFRFEPGRNNDTVSAMTLRVAVQIGDVGPKPIVHFPVGVRPEVDKSEHYWAAFETLGIQPARLRSFPSYNFEIDPLSDWFQYEYKFFRVDLDTLGEVTAVELVRSTSPAFTEQIRAAIDWGEYEPMRVKSRAVPSTNYLVVALLPNAAYPTKAVSFESAESLPIWDRLRIRLLPDTIGELMPPVPKRDWSGAIADSVHRMSLAETVVFALEVDTLGTGVIERIGNSNWKIRSLLNRLSHDRRFFPALDFAGQTRPWTDLARMVYPSADSVRVWFRWGEPGPRAITYRDRPIP
ncbi:MAG: hypothetical protein AB1772_04855 [Candidatus Zixiibacteriota bacterium]